MEPIKNRLASLILKLSVTVALLGLAMQPYFCYGQDVSVTKTEYTKTGDGSIGKENFSFSLSNSTLTITDLDYNRAETYGPLKLVTSGFEGSLYYETYGPDLSSDPAHYQKWTNNIRNYKLVFDKKGGNLIIIIEGKVKSNNQTLFKIYYTAQGRAL